LRQDTTTFQVQCLTLQALLCQQGVAQTGRNRTGPPWSVGRPIATRPTRPLNGSVTDDDNRRRQTPATATSLPVPMCRRAINNPGCLLEKATR